MLTNTYIERLESSMLIVCPPLFPFPERLTSRYGALLWGGERLSLTEFSERIRVELGTLVDAKPNEADRFGFELAIWEALVKRYEKCISNSEPLPEAFQFRYDGVDIYYSKDECLSFLGEPAANYFLSKIEERPVLH